MRGRKKKNMPPAKERRITIRLTEDQYSVLKKECRSSQLSVSEYIRRLLLNRKIPIYPIIIHDEHEILEELRKINKIGKNLNRIARHFNSNGLMTNEVYKELKETIRLLHGTCMKYDEAVEKEYYPTNMKNVRET